MKTKHGYYYVFFDVLDFWDKVYYFKSKNYLWYFNPDKYYDPIVLSMDMPCVLSVDSRNFTMLYGKVLYDKEHYFSDPIFVKLYKQEERKYKLRKILEK